MICLLVSNIIFIFATYNIIIKHYMETLKIPDMVMGMLGVVPSDTIGTDDKNGRIAYHKYLEEKYNGK